MKHILQAVAVIGCIVIAAYAPHNQDHTTELFFVSIGGSAICAAWIFLTSSIGKS
ncbi:hypothetical protein OM076_18590 [Solirubrobacter ginsenosidimutans]|uniref:Uncharacterized protein n=1 Tax=Solirubrobacter ginsenosidimutans TaxID=490573 RepID=A0A9X3S3N4_9ACTN|nr:hypothetical protein [Solirubrobacter ginsenosidimutans]MDA0162286.1 hypothetical protein [Solirubrobacter ginsenosidimutans]